MSFSSHLAQISLVIVLIFGNEIDVLVFSHDLLFLLGTKCVCNLEYTNQITHATGITHANGHTFMSIISWMFCYLLSLINSALSRYTLKKKMCTVARIMLYKNIHVWCSPGQCLTRFLVSPLDLDPVVENKTT